MEAIIKITEQNGKQAVSARELYEKLGYDSTQWARWYKKNIYANQFAIEGEDYVGFDTMSKTSEGGRPTQDFALSLDFAKKLSMMSRTETGERIRNYFLEVEKQAKELTKPLSTLDILEMSIKQIREQEQRVTAIESKVLEIEAKTTTRPEYFTIVGYAMLNHIQIGLTLASQLGRKAAGICKSKGYPMDEVPDPRFGRVRSYPKMVLQEVFNNSISG